MAEQINESDKAKSDWRSALDRIGEARHTGQLIVMVIACFGLAVIIPFMPSMGIKLDWPWYRYAISSAAAVLAGLALIYLWLRSHRII